MFEFVALTAAISAVVAARAGAEEANVKAANEAKRQYAESVRLASSYETARAQASSVSGVMEYRLGVPSAAEAKCPCCGSRQFQVHAARRICAYCRSEQDGRVRPARSLGVLGRES